MDEMELDHNHSRPLHGETAAAALDLHLLVLRRSGVNADDVVEASRSRELTAACVCLTGLLRLLSGEVQTPDVQQGVQVPRLGHRPGLVLGLDLHDVHPNGDGHQDLTV